MSKRLSKALWSIYERMATVALGPLLRHEGKHSTGCERSFRSVEYSFALRHIASTAASDLLDVGCGQTSWPHVLKATGLNVTAVDKVSGYWRLLFTNRHYPVKRVDITRPVEGLGKFDIITCISVIEHIPDYRAAMINMAALLRPGGRLIVTAPHSLEAYCPNVYQTPEASYGADWPFVCQSFSEGEPWKDAGFHLVEEEYYETHTGRMWAQGAALFPPLRVTRPWRHQLGCWVLRKGGE